MNDERERLRLASKHDKRMLKQPNPKIYIHGSKKERTQALLELEGLCFHQHSMKGDLGYVCVIKI